MANHHTTSAARRRRARSDEIGALLALPMTGLRALTIADELRGKARLAWALIDGVAVRAESPELVREIEDYGREVRAALRRGPSGDVPGAADARDLYQGAGLGSPRRALQRGAAAARAEGRAALPRQHPGGRAEPRLRCASSFPSASTIAGVPEPAGRGCAGAATARATRASRKAHVNVDGTPALVDEDARSATRRRTPARAMIALGPRRRWSSRTRPSPRQRAAAARHRGHRGAADPPLRRADGRAGARPAGLIRAQVPGSGAGRAGATFGS